MKRFFAILLTLALVVCCFAACGKKDENNGDENGDKAPAYESQVEVQGGTLELQTAVEDTTLYVSVVMQGNTGFAAFTLNLEYDNTKCVAREFTGSELIDCEEITSNIHQYEAGSDGRAALNSASAFWVSPANITGDGVLFTLAFDVVDASAEDFGLKLVCANDSFANQNFEAVMFTVK
ncbi:MAG: hypothetical protein II297_00665 [Clostridia bacterium]|nr:hypothetical protein [Clostridia bacterium]